MLEHEILKKMSLLYIMFCMPDSFNIDTGEIKYRWTNTHAEKLYKEYIELYNSFRIKDVQNISDTK
uniref:Uncharacterized protein n=1 Tax=viral metagenome TaxID=1070528 RepID=A0A6M3IXK7_9ZZZZ